MKKRLLLIVLFVIAILTASCSSDIDSEKNIHSDTEITLTPTATATVAPTAVPTTAPVQLPTEAPASDEPSGIIKIAVIDTGISSTVINPDNILPGQNYICPEQDTEDRVGHGTAVSAFIVGSGPARMEGTCPDAKLVPLVYVDKKDEEQIVGEPKLVAQAVRDAVDTYGCRIILISSGTKDDEVSLHEAVKYAEENNVLVVSCAGNSGNTEPDAVFYPGAYEEVLCVGSVNEDGEVASFSQNNEYVDIWEIGTDLRLATLKGTRIRGEGTSYSAAIVAGKAAVILLQNERLTVDELIEKLKE